MGARSRDTEFREQPLSSIDEVLGGILGERPLQATVWLLEKGFQIKDEEIPERLGDFQNALAKLFGVSASVIMRTTARAFVRQAWNPIPANKPLQIQDVRRGLQTQIRTEAYRANGLESGEPNELGSTKSDRNFC